jgi:predicted HAD superfamily Cof-like phosphohydrolase
VDKEWELVKQFHSRFGTPYRDKPSLLEADRVHKRASWLIEEIEEFQKAKTIEDQADAMIDTIYFALGTLVEMGVQPDELFQIVHRANMSKLWDDGKPRYRSSDGKVIKPPTWEDPKPKMVQAIMKQKEK